MIAGVLALQGNVPEQRRTLAHAKGIDEVVLVRRPDELARVDVLLMPGGESTTISDLLERTGLWRPLAERLREGLPVLGTCAGLILLATEVERAPTGRDPKTFEVLPVRLRRNDYGSQVESFEAPVRVEGLRGGDFPGVFIRAPRILEIGPGSEAFAYQGKEIVGVRKGGLWGLTFHPELSDDPRILDSFLADARRRQRSTRSSTARTTKRTPTDAARK